MCTAIMPSSARPRMASTPRIRDFFGAPDSSSKVPAARSTGFTGLGVAVVGVLSLMAHPPRASSSDQVTGLDQRPPDRKDHRNRGVKHVPFSHLAVLPVGRSAAKLVDGFSGSYHRAEG